MFSLLRHHQWCDPVRGKDKHVTVSLSQTLAKVSHPAPKRDRSWESSFWIKVQFCVNYTRDQTAQFSFKTSTCRHVDAKKHLYYNFISYLILCSNTIKKYLNLNVQSGKWAQGVGKTSPRAGWTADQKSSCAFSTRRGAFQSSLCQVIKNILFPTQYQLALTSYYWSPINLSD